MEHFAYVQKEIGARTLFVLVLAGLGWGCCWFAALLALPQVHDLVYVVVVLRAAFDMIITSTLWDAQQRWRCIRGYGFSVHDGTAKVHISQSKKAHVSGQSPVSRSTYITIN